MAKGAKRATGIHGVVASMSRRQVRGWVVDRSDPARKLAVELVSGGRAVALAPADQERPGLARLELGRTDLGFTLPVPAGVPLDLATLSVRVAGSGEPLPIGKATDLLEGMVESAVGTRVTGWAWRVGYPEERVAVRVLSQGHSVAEIVADLPRPDLAEARIGDGYHAFAIELLELPGGHAFHVDDIEVRFAETGRPLHDMRKGRRPARGPASAAPPVPTPVQSAPRPEPKIQVIPPRKPVYQAIAPVKPPRRPEGAAPGSGDEGRKRH